MAANGSRTLMESEETSLWHGDFKYTQRRFKIQNFASNNEGLYMCVIRRPADNYTAETEIYLRLRVQSRFIDSFYKLI